MVAEFYYVEFSRQFRFWKRARSSSYVTDDKDENGRKGGVRKESNYFKIASKKRYGYKKGDIYGGAGRGDYRYFASVFKNYNVQSYFHPGDEFVYGRCGGQDVGHI